MLQLTNSHSSPSFMNIDGKILSISNPEDEKFLRHATASFDFKKHTKKETSELIKRMRLIMYEANGVGLAANQIGINLSVFVAKVDNKFYSFFNPLVLKSSDEMVAREEGCLSVPAKFGRVYRNDKIVLQAQDKNGKAVKIKAWGLLATVFQHEVDHLNGKLFIDKLA